MVPEGRGFGSAIGGYPTGYAAHAFDEQLEK